MIELFRCAFYPKTTFHGEHVLNQIPIGQNSRLKVMYCHVSSGAFDLDEMAVINDLEETQVIRIFTVQRKAHKAKISIDSTP